jgi:6-phosphogluconolactonase
MESVNSKLRVTTVDDTEALAKKASEIFIRDARRAIEANTRFYVAISGGLTPRRVFELIGAVPDSLALPWQKIELFWVDERCVPPDSSASNYRLAAETFLPKVPIPRDNVHRIRAESSDCEAAAGMYEEEIRRTFSIRQGQVPKFDLIILGMGPDGHTGSLFRNSYAPFDKEDLACVVYSMSGDYNRITMTHPVLQAASHVVILVSGSEKAAILREVLTAECDEVRYPIHIIWPVLEKVTWLVDSKAAKLL